MLYAQVGITVRTYLMNILVGYTGWEYWWDILLVPTPGMHQLNELVGHTHGTYWLYALAGITVWMHQMNILMEYTS